MEITLNSNINTAINSIDNDSVTIAAPTSRFLDTLPAIQQAGTMKATFQIPDDLYREVKAETDREGRTVRDVAISLLARISHKDRREKPQAVQRQGASQVSG